VRVRGADGAWRSVASFAARNGIDLQRRPRGQAARVGPRALRPPGAPREHRSSERPRRELTAAERAAFEAKAALVLARLAAMLPPGESVRLVAPGAPLAPGDLVVTWRPSAVDGGWCSQTDWNFKTRDGVVVRSFTAVAALPGVRAAPEEEPAERREYAEARQRAREARLRPPPAPAPAPAAPPAAPAPPREAAPPAGSSEGAPAATEPIAPRPCWRSRICSKPYSCW
jgi:pilus assembly protein FimV